MTTESIRTYSYRIAQASKTELVVIMYDMAEEYISNAILALQDDNIENFHSSLKYARRVVHELSSSLDMQYKVAQELFQLYLCIDRLMSSAGVSRSIETLNRITGMLGKLRDSFYEISRTDKSGPVMQNTQQVYSGLTYSNVGQSNEVSQDPVKNRGYIV